MSLVTTWSCLLLFCLNYSWLVVAINLRLRPSPDPTTSSTSVNSASCEFDPRLRAVCTGTYQDEFLRKDVPVYDNMWNHRAQIAVKYLGNHSRRVLDYGSGSGYIRTILPASVKAYHGVDVRPHAAYAAEVCNINDGFVTAVPTKDSEQR